jgi:hypothetical protein
MRVLLLCCALLLASGSGALLASEQRPKPGLLWQTTGLPAVFPLVIKSRSGTDHYMTLHSPESGDAVLAAYVRGGEFFRVLVPPGTFVVRFARGQTWLGEEVLFGDATGWVFLEDTLTFEVRGHGTKAGHIIDLTRDDGVPIIEAHAECQRYMVERLPRPQAPFDSKGYATRLGDPGEIVRPPQAGFDPERLGGSDGPAVPTDHAPYFSRPSFRVQPRVC